MDRLLKAFDFAILVSTYDAFASVRRRSAITAKKNKEFVTKGKIVLKRPVLLFDYPWRTGLSDCRPFYYTLEIYCRQITTHQN
jgi:hypothetical protein